MSAYELIGVDIEEEGGQDLPRALLEMQDGLQKLDERYYVWVVTDKRFKTEAAPFPEMQSNFLSDLIAERDSARYRDGTVFSLVTHVFILLGIRILMLVRIKSVPTRSARSVLECGLRSCIQPRSLHVGSGLLKT